MGLARLGASPPVPLVNPPDTEAADTEAADTEADLQRRQTMAPLETTVPVEQGARLGKRAPGG